ncbi:MAG TPA: 6-phosphogluconolactonase [Candidatus Acidoferrales bacterium]|nr:6-phosphogluconolactonase [Candidatus Acidoferrales bacterium]
MAAGINHAARVYADLDALSRAAVEECVRAANQAAGARGRCLIALSGGHTPERAYRLWATEYREKMPWAKTHFFWGDERFVPAGDAKSNYRMAQGTLFNSAPVPAENIHPIETNFATADDAARAYEKVLRNFIDEGEPSFDVMFLGLGPEGHTASLFPGSPALAEEERWVVGVRAPAEPPVRISLTFPVLRRARETYFLVAGADKQEIISKLRRESPAEIADLPVAMLKPEGEVIWFLDQAADGAHSQKKSAT